MTDYSEIPQALTKLPDGVIAWTISYAYNGGPYAARIVVWDDETGAREFEATHEFSAAGALLDAIAMVGVDG